MEGNIALKLAQLLLVIILHKDNLLRWKGRCPMSIQVEEIGKRGVTLDLLPGFGWPWVLGSGRSRLLSCGQQQEMQMVEQRVLSVIFKLILIADAQVKAANSNTGNHVNIGQLKEG